MTISTWALPCRSLSRMARARSRALLRSRMLDFPPHQAKMLCREGGSPGHSPLLHPAPTEEAPASSSSLENYPQRQDRRQGQTPEALEEGSDSPEVRRLCPCIFLPTSPSPCILFTLLEPISLSRK